MKADVAKQNYPSGKAIDEFREATNAHRPPPVTRATALPKLR